jgi:hypothetical protein
LFDEQAPAEPKGIFEAFDPGEDVERAAGLRGGE